MELSLKSLSTPCSCGRAHTLEVERIFIEANLLNKIYEFLIQKQLNSCPMIICDFNTYPLGVEQLKEQLNLNAQQVICLNPAHLHADEYALKAIRKQLDMKVSVLIAFGSGTIHDLTRYTAFKLNIPFISVPTAASVDGFASTVAAMTFKGFKVTIPAKAPLAIFADTAIISKAPSKLTAAGVGDLLAKFTALADWKISHLLTGEYLCDKIVTITEEALQTLLNVIDDLALQKEEAFEPLMHGLILSGLGMQMIGNSRPASGAEHHLSHLWEMHVINDEIEALHGEKVGVGLAYVCELYRSLLELKEAPAFKEINLYDEQTLSPIFNQLTTDILKENEDDCLNQVKEDVFKLQFNQIKALIEKLPTATQVRTWLKQVGGKTILTEIGLEEGLKEQSLAVAPYVRNRLTLLRLIKVLDLS